MIDGHTAAEVSGGEVAGEEPSRLRDYVRSRLEAGAAIPTIKLAR